VVMLDINADAGESFGRWSLGNDEGLMNFVTSVSIAAGFHAGDPATMSYSVRTAKHRGVQLGVHPGLPDLLGFGRRAFAIEPEEAADYCVYQLGALMGFAAREGIAVEHVKLHGALYGMAAKDPKLAVAIADAVQKVDESLLLVLMDGPGAEAAEQTGIKVVREAFPDLDYEDDGTLIIERVKTLRDPDDVAERAIKIADGFIVTKGGRELPTKAQTICIHGDVGNAVDVARRVRERLEAVGITVAPMRALASST
jgi:UPF0271 protein